MKRTYFFNLLKMKMLSIRLIISVFCMVFMNFLVVMPDIRANYDTLDIVYLFRFTYDIGSFSRLLPLLAAFVMADAVAQDFCDHTMPFRDSSQSPPDGELLCFFYAFDTHFWRPAATTLKTLFCSRLDNGCKIKIRVYI